jgi:hypothetical protein
MAERNAGHDGRLWWINSQPTPPGASSQWVGRGRCRRICLHSLNRLLRKKVFIDGIHFIFLYNLSLIISNTITFHPPCALHRSRVLSCTSPVAPACFWLVVECNCVVYWAFKVATYFSLIFCRSILRPNRRHGPIPHAPIPVASLLHRPLNHFRQLPFDCCVPQLNGGHLRPIVLQSLYFFHRSI